MKEESSIGQGGLEKPLVLAISTKTLTTATAHLLIRTHKMEQNQHHHPHILFPSQEPNKVQCNNIG